MQIPQYFVSGDKGELGIDWLVDLLTDVNVTSKSLIYIMHINISATTHRNSNISANIKGSTTSKNLIYYAQ